MISFKDNRFMNWIGKITLSVLMVSIVINCNSNPRSGDSYPVSGIKFISIPGGTCQMGDAENLNICYDQKPAHQVTLSAFEMSVY